MKKFKQTLQTILIRNFLKGKVLFKTSPYSFLLYYIAYNYFCFPQPLIKIYFL